MQTAELRGISRNSVNTYLTAIRRHIAEFCESESPFSGQVEVDESLFGAREVKGKRRRNAYGKVLVFGLYKRNRKGYTEVVPNASKKTLQAIIMGKVALESVIHSDGWRGYNGLVDLGYAKHLHVDHGRNEFATSTSHINGMEGFWDLLKPDWLSAGECTPLLFTCILKSPNSDSIIVKKISIQNSYL